MALHGKPYKAKTLSGAQRRVRDLEKLYESTSKLLDRYAAERKLMARLAASTPQFDSPIEAWEAQALRDSILSGKA